MANLSTPQPAPVPTNETPVVDLVIEDFKERLEFGRRKYGSPLTVSNGRDHLKDCYQEILDLTVYLRAEIERREQAPVTAQAVIDFLREEAREECYTEAALPYSTVKDLMFLIADRIERNHPAPVQESAPELTPNAKVIEQLREHQLHNLADYLGGQIATAPSDTELDDLRRYQEYVTFCQCSAVEPQSFGDFLSYGRMS